SRWPAVVLRRITQAGILSKRNRSNVQIESGAAFEFELAGGERNSRFLGSDRQWRNETVSPGMPLVTSWELFSLPRQTFAVNQMPLRLYLSYPCGNLMFPP